MKEINGQFIMDGCDPNDPKCIDTPDQLVALLRTAGFLPLFSSSIPGFSVEEHTPSGYWWTGEDSDPWEWRHVLASHPEIAYGKFFGKKAGFIHKDWFPVFASFRRNGYDFDALCDDELAPFKWKKAMDLFGLNDQMVGKTLPASSIAEEGIKIDLQMRTYLIITDFNQKRSKKGVPYGMHRATLATPETKWGYDYVTSDYHDGWEGAWEKIRDHILQLYPPVDEKVLWPIVGMRIISLNSEEMMEPKKTKTIRFPDDLIKKIGGISLPLSEDQTAGLRNVITTLNDKEQQAIKMRFEEGQTIRAIADAFGVTPARVQQIMEKATRKLRHPTRITYIINGLEALNRQRGEVICAGQHSNFPVAALGLSTRISNALINQGINTVANLCDTLVNDPEKIRSLPAFGFACAVSLLKTLKTYGIEFEGHSIQQTATELWAGRKIRIRDRHAETQDE